MLYFSYLLKKECVMSIYDRDYYRETYNQRQSGGVNAVFIIIIINVIVFFVVNILLSRQPQSWQMISLGGLSVKGVKSGYIWQFVSYFFLHSGFMHIIFNMYFLYLSGSNLERVLGKKEFLTFYFACGIGSGFLSFLVYLFTNANILLIGASGAIFGCMLAFGTFYPDAQMIAFFIIPVRLKARIFILLYLGLELFRELTGGVGNVSHLTHLFGALVAYFYIRFRFRMDPIKILLGNSFF